jgi:hypothetical protein
VHLSTSDTIAVVIAVGTCASALIAVVSAGVAVVALRRARTAQDRSAGHEATTEQHSRRAAQAAEEAATAQRRSAAAAEESVAAQAESAAAAQRSAEALEKQIQMAEELAELDEGSPWNIRLRSGVVCELWNITKRPKFGVEISGPGVSQGRHPEVFDRIDGNSCKPFHGASAWGSDPSVTVTWYNRENRAGEQRMWSGTRPELG